MIGVAHAKWQERPLLIVVKKAGRAMTRDDLPHTATGKLQKMKLRETFRDYRLPGEWRAPALVARGLQEARMNGGRAIAALSRPDIETP